MEEPNDQTQKEVGRKYRNNLAYFKKSSFMGRERFLLCGLALLLGIYAIFWLESTRWDKGYNPAPLSISHANLEGNCAACHNPAARNILHAMQGGDPKEATPKDAPAVHDWTSIRPVAFSSSASINQACQKCHADKDLHQPTTQTLALNDFRSELHIVHANGCFNCHQEHLGRIDLKLPGDSACAACHNDAAQMAANFTRVPLPGNCVSGQAIDGVTSDGVPHFIPPERKGPLPLFTSFEQGHPPFEYEQPGLKDPDVLTFSHRQHLAPGMKLSCADCHKPAAEGVYYQRVTYAGACQRCHTLQLDPDNPNLLIPHGDIARLRSFLHSLPYQYEKLDEMNLAAQKKAPPSPADEKAFAFRQIVALLQRAHAQGPDDFEREIIFTANPYKDRPPTMQRPFFSGCAYCHQVTQPQGGGDPVVTPPVMAERWLAHGAFTHAKHTFMSCVACHDAEQSRVASDILMPAKASCVSCHRPQGIGPSNCLACHSFHSPELVVRTVKAQWPLVETGSCPEMEAPGKLSKFLISEQPVKQ